jgi:hypothetical protein
MVPLFLKVLRPLLMRAEIFDDRSLLLQVIVRQIVRVCQIIPIRLVVVAPITDICPGRAQKLVDPVIVTAKRAQIRG